MPSFVSPATVVLELWNFGPKREVPPGAEVLRERWTKSMYTQLQNPRNVAARNRERQTINGREMPRTKKCPHKERKEADDTDP